MIELADEQASVLEHRKSAIMATVPNQRRMREIEYPSGEGKPWVNFAQQQSRTQARPQSWCC